jgi:hypothetical protein
MKIVTADIGGETTTRDCTFAGVLTRLAHDLRFRRAHQSFTKTALKPK